MEKVKELPEKNVVAYLIFCSSICKLKSLFFAILFVDKIGVIQRRRIVIAGLHI